MCVPNHALSNDSLPSNDTSIEVGVGYTCFKCVIYVHSNDTNATSDYIFCDGK